MSRGSDARYRALWRRGTVTGTRRWRRALFGVPRPLSTTLRSDNVAQVSCFANGTGHRGTLVTREHSATWTPTTLTRCRTRSSGPSCSGRRAGRHRGRPGLEQRPPDGGPVAARLARRRRTAPRWPPGCTRAPPSGSPPGPARAQAPSRTADARTLALAAATCLPAAAAGLLAADVVERRLGRPSPAGRSCSRSPASGWPSPTAARRTAASPRAPPLSPRSRRSPPSPPACRAAAPRSPPCARPASHGSRRSASRC